MLDDNEYKYLMYEVILRLVSLGQISFREFSNFRACLGDQIVRPRYDNLIDKGIVDGETYKEFIDRIKEQKDEERRNRENR